MISNPSKRIQREGDLWGANVWFGSHYPANLRRYYYRTRAEARSADISHDAKNGLVVIGKYL